MKSPCKFCQSRDLSPCVKSLGPKTEARSATRSLVSRALTIYDPTIDPADVHLLQYAYSDAGSMFVGANFIPNEFFQTFVPIYGQSIKHFALREAIIAVVTRRHHEIAPSTSFHLVRANSAIAALANKLYNPALLDEGDLLVSCLLILWSTQEKNARNFLVNVNGFASIMEHLSDRVGGRVESYELAILWHLARDLIYSISRYEFFIDPECERFGQVLRLVLGTKRITPYARYTEVVYPNRFDYSPLTLLLPLSHYFDHLLETLIRHAVFQTGKTNVAPQPSQSFKDIDDDLKGSEAAELERLCCQYVTMNTFHVVSWTLAYALVMLYLHLSRQVCQLLNAPSIVEGLTAPEGLETATKIIDSMIRIENLTNRLGNYSKTSPELSSLNEWSFGSAAFGTYIKSTYHSPSFMLIRRLSLGCLSGRPSKRGGRRSSERLVGFVSIEIAQMHFLQYPLGRV